jgi:hypothetical protein
MASRHEHGEDYERKHHVTGDPAKTGDSVAVDSSEADGVFRPRSADEENLEAGPVSENDPNYYEAERKLYPDSGAEDDENWETVTATDDRPGHAGSEGHTSRVRRNRNDDSTGRRGETGQRNSSDDE